MEVTIAIQHVNGLKSPKVSIEDGTVSYILPFDVQMVPGDFERVVQLFKQRVPVTLTVASPQAKFDLFTEMRGDAGAFQTFEEQQRLRRIAHDSLKASQIAEGIADASGDTSDRQNANALADEAANAIGRAAEAMDLAESLLLDTLAEEIRIEILSEGERQADSEAADAADPEATRRDIDAHASQEEAAAEKTPPKRRSRKPAATTA